METALYYFSLKSFIGQQYIKNVCDLYPSEIVFSDVAGIKELQFRATINSIDVLDRYYEAN